MIKITTGLFIAALVLTGCTVKAHVSEEDANKLMVCTDTRDGEVFSFNTNTVTNMRAGFGVPSSFDILTTEGKEMTLNNNMEAWLKCVDGVEQLINQKVPVDG